MIPILKYVVDGRVLFGGNSAAEDVVPVGVVRLPCQQHGQLAGL